MSITPYLKAGKKAYRAKIKFRNRQYTKSGFKTQEDAKTWMVEERRRLKKIAGQPRVMEATKLMYSAASALYLADSKARHQPGTFTEKSRHLTEFIESIGYDLPVEEISPEQAHAFISGTQKKTTNKTANRYLRSLKAFWTWTSRRHSIGSNPFILVEPYPEDTAPRYIPPMKDVLSVLSVTEAWERDFLIILVKTAARPGEVRTLTWEDIDFARNTITLWTRKRKGGARQPRVINMSGQLTETLKLRHAQRENETWVFCEPRDKKAFHTPEQTLQVPNGKALPAGGRQRVTRHSRIYLLYFPALRGRSVARLRQSQPIRDSTNPRAPAQRHYRHLPALARPGRCRSGQCSG